jgi:signal transduction histidine kinase/CheY-like chemotaxis protein
VCAFRVGPAELCRVGIVFNDITERRQSEEALRRLNSELESRVQARTEELMESQGRLRALATGLNLAEQRERQRLAADLHDYLGQLLALSLIKLGQAIQKPMEATLGKLFGEVIESTEKALTYTRTLVSQLCPPVLQEFGLPVALQWLGEQMHQQNLGVSVEFKTEIPPVPEDQALRLFQSVRELLLNCVKHGRTHEATITVEQSEGSLRITVSDHGCGFDASARAANKINADFPAFGLFSVRERMLSLGGRLAMESALGKGTVATLIVPLSQASVEPSTVADQSTNVKEVSESSRIRGQLAKTVEKMGNGDLSHQPALSAIGSKIRVLIADDHAMMRQGLRSVLDQYSEIQVVGEAANGEEAVVLANQLHPDVILMDVTMPKMDGIEATKLIKRSWPDMVVIGLSVHTAGQVGRAMTDAGAAAFINKEAAVNELYEAIHAVGRSTGLRHLGATT